MLVFMDGQAHYDTTRIALKYSTVDATGVTWSVVPEGRFGNAIKRVSTTNTAGTGYLDISPLTTRTGVWAPTTGGVCGFALRINNPALSVPNENGPTTSGALFAVLDGANFILKVILNPAGTLSLVQAWGPLDNYGAIIATSAEGLPVDAWSFVECKWLIHASAGSFEIRVNTVPVLTYSGDTTSHNPSWMASGTWNAVRLLQLDAVLGPPWLTTRHCDLYLADLASADADDVSDFLGDGIIETIMPNGPGDATSWTPEPAATPNWDATNDRPAPDDDATYVRTTAVGQRDLYHFEDIPAGSVVKGIHINVLARKEEEGSSTIAPLLRPAGTSTDYRGTTQGVATPTYDRYITQAWDLNPATGAKFTAAEINASQWGVEKML